MLPCAMKRLQILLLGGLDRHEPHRRPQSGFVNSLGIRRIVLGSFDEGLHKPGIDQQDPAVIGKKTPAPIMRAGASFHDDGFRTQLLNGLKKSRATDLTRNDHAISINAMAVERALTEIDSK